MKRITVKLLMIFVTLQAVLYVAFLTLDFYGKHTNISNFIKYFIIILCFCYTLLPIKSVNKSILFYLRIGLLFTVISDFFLLMADYFMITDSYFYGVLTFILAQQFYGIRIDATVYETDTVTVPHKRRTLTRAFLIRVLLQISITLLICFTLLQWKVALEKLIVVSIFYFLCILTNTLRAVKVANDRRRRKETGLILYSIGMVLFLLCDINVGLYNLSSFIALPSVVYETISHFSSILMWTFYAPSQVLIAISSHK